MLMELRFACRQLIRHKGLTLTAILTLSLGIGATTAIFSVLHPVVIEPLPYPEPERLVRIFESLPDGGRNSVSGGAFLDWQDQSSSFESLAVYEPVRHNLSGVGSRPELVHGLRVSTGFLSTYGVTPHLGRDFATGEDQPGGENRVVALSHGLWRGRFGGKEDVLGRQIKLDQENYQVIAVLPPAALLEVQVEYLIPTVINGNPEAWGRSGHWRSVIGRLAAGVTVEGAQAELSGIRERLAEHYPAFKEKWGVAVTPLQEAVGGQARPTLFLLLGMVFMVLLISCANVSNLLLARGQARSQEMAVRGALGAERWRIMRHMLVESLVLAALGAVGGLIVASFGIDLLASTVAGELPQAIRPELDWRVLTFALVLTLGSGLLFGLLPAWRASRASVQNDLKEGSRGTTSGARQRSLRTLVVAEFAFTLVLLIGAGLFLRSFLSVLDVDPGFVPEQTLGFDIVFPAATYPEQADRMAFIDDLNTRLTALPGVEAAGAGSFLPLSRAGRTEFLSRVENEEQTDYVVGANFVSGDYLHATGMDLLRGRAFETGDFSAEAERVVMIDQGVANDLYPGENPIGQQVRFLRQPWRIVGVVSPVRHWQLDAVPRPFLYIPQSHAPFSTSFIVRSSLEPLALSGMIRQAVGQIDGEQAVANIRTLEQAVETSLFARRVTLTLLSLFAGLGVLLAAIGIYGVMAYAVSQRDRELAIRTAFGAKRGDLISLVVKDGMGPTFLGIALGTAAALGGARLIESQLYEIRAQDPLVVAFSIGLLSLVAVVAILLPAYRVATADPSRVMRSE